MKIAIANDHRGLKLKNNIIKHLKKNGYDIENLGTNTSDNVDFTDMGFKLGEYVATNKDYVGIAICGTGIGISIACNKVDGVRCAKVDNKEEARLTKEHNNANVIALNGTMSSLKANKIVDSFLEAEFLNLDRYNRRIKSLAEYEKNK